MQIASVNTGLPRLVEWRGESVQTAIFKMPVSGPVNIAGGSLDGDRQADLTVHGGANKAVYAYSLSHYDFWRDRLKRDDIGPGAFGENLTISGGLDEGNVFVGELYRAGTAVLRAVQPRLPCYKLGIRFGTMRMVKQFSQAGRYGVYFSIDQEGVVAAGDGFSLVEPVSDGVSIRDIGRMLLEGAGDEDLLLRASRLKHLPERLREHLESLLIEE